MGTAGMRLGLVMISVIALGADQVSELGIAFSDCPAAVQKTLKREAFDSEIKGVYKEGEDKEAVLCRSEGFDSDQKFLDTLRVFQSKSSEWQKHRK